MTLLHFSESSCQYTCEDGDGKLTPSSFRDLMVAPIRLNCGSFWKSSAHSTIRAFSFSHTLGCAWRRHENKQLWSLALVKILTVTLNLKFLWVWRTTRTRNSLDKIPPQKKEGKKKKRKPGKFSYLVKNALHFTGKLPWADFQVEYFATVWYTSTQQLQAKTVK